MGAWAPTIFAVTGLRQKRLERRYDAGYRASIGEPFLRGRALTRQFRDATRAGRDLQAEAMQFGDCAHQAQSQSQPEIAPTLVRTVEAPRHEFAFVGGNSGSGVADPHDGLVALSKQT